MDNNSVNKTGLSEEALKLLKPIGVSMLDKKRLEILETKHNIVPIDVKPKNGVYEIRGLADPERRKLYKRKTPSEDIKFTFTLRDFQNYVCWAVCSLWCLDTPHRDGKKLIEAIKNGSDIGEFYECNLMRSLFVTRKDLHFIGYNHKEFKVDEKATQEITLNQKEVWTLLEYMRPPNKRIESNEKEIKDALAKNKGLQLLVDYMDAQRVETKEED